MYSPTVDDRPEIDGPYDWQLSTVHNLNMLWMPPSPPSVLTSW